MFEGIDLSSDTATRPSPGMLECMMQAKVGDEQKGEDPTTALLESTVAKMFNVTAAMFCPSATMANQIAIQCLCEPGDELLAASNSHIFRAESGSPAVLARVMCNPITTATGLFTPEDILNHHHPRTSHKNPHSTLLSIENSSNLGGGTTWSEQQLAEIMKCAKSLSLKTHMDGARIFNASVKTGMPVSTIASGFDMVTICLSKGLGCPVGAVLILDEQYRDKALHLKQLFGGGLRQSGILAAAGLYALKHNITRLSDDHANATHLAKSLAQTPNIEVLTHSPQTNIVLFKWTGTTISADHFHDQCIKQHVRFSRVGDSIFRAVTHLDINIDGLNRAIQIVKKTAQTTITMRI